MNIDLGDVLLVGWIIPLLICVYVGGFGKGWRYW